METQKAKIVAKTIDVRGNGNLFFGTISTNYYLTFEFEDKERYFFQVSAEEFALSVEGDYGNLIYKIKNTLSGEKLVFDSFDRIG